MALPLNHSKERRTLCISQAGREKRVAATVAAIQRGGWAAGQERYAALSVEERQIVKAALEADNAMRRAQAARARTDKATPCFGRRAA